MIGDKEIIDHMWQGYEDAITSVKEKYHRLCIKLSYNITGNMPDAEECVNDSYMKLWNAIPPNRPNSLKAFLLRIVKNTAIDRVRKDKRRLEGAGLKSIYAELGECIADDRPQDDLADLTRLLNRFLEQTDLDNRRIFIKRYWYSQSIIEISIEEGLKESTIKMRLFRMREKLKKELEREGISI